MEPSTLAALGNLSGPAFLVAAIIAGARAVWVWGWAHRAEIAAKDAIIEQKDREIVYYRNLAFRLANITEKVTEAAEQRTGMEPWAN